MEARENEVDFMEGLTVKLYLKNKCEFCRRREWPFEEDGEQGGRYAGLPCFL